MPRAATGAHGRSATSCTGVATARDSPSSTRRRRSPRTAWRWARSLFFRDITECRGVERMKDEFVSVVSHELRTPLTSRRGSLGLLAGGALGSVPERGRSMLDIAVSSSDRLVRLINDILDMQRIKRGKSPSSFGTSTPPPCSTQRRGNGGHGRPGRRRAVHRTGRRLGPGRSRPHHPDTDQPALQRDQVLISRRAGDPGLRARGRGAGVQGRRPREGGSPPPSSRRCSSFFTRSTPPIRARDGIGLGLAISRSIVEQHGGRLWVESEVGRGTIFRFTVPCAGHAAPGRRPDAVAREGPRVTASQ